MEDSSSHTKEKGEYFISMISSMDFIYCMHCRPKYLAEINVVGATFKSVIPAGQADFKSYGNSRVDRPINVLAYRGHTHTLGTSTSLYKVSPDSEEVTLITKSDPRQPQTLEILKETVAIEEGDYIVVQCNYNTESKRYKTKFGRYISVSFKDQM